MNITNHHKSPLKLGLKYQSSLYCLYLPSVWASGLRSNIFTECWNSGARPKKKRYTREERKRNSPRRERPREKERCWRVVVLALDLVSSDCLTKTSHWARAVIASGRRGAGMVAIGEKSAMPLFVAATTCRSVWHRLWGDDGYSPGAAF